MTAAAQPKRCSRFELKVTTGPSPRAKRSEVEGPCVSLWTSPRKAAATTASARDGVFVDFYAGLSSKGMKPEMARLTLARKIAAITLKIWKEGEAFDTGHLKSQAA